MWQKIKCWFRKTTPKPRTVLARADFDGEWFRFKVHKGNQIYLIWFGYPFPIELQEDGSTICKKKGIKDLCLYRFDKRPNREIFKVQRIRELNVHYITMFDWEIVDE